MNDADSGYSTQECEGSESQTVAPTLPPETISELWGYLQPCGPGPSQILFPKAICRWSFGRKGDGNVNSVVLNGLKISSQHCVISYQGSNKVTVLDMSSNGTWINGKKIGKGNTAELFNGNEICFGTTIPQPQNGGVSDYRYIYRHAADGQAHGGFFDNFELGYELGKGAFGLVLETTHKSSKIKFAVKIIRQNSLSMQRFSESTRLDLNRRIVREISLMRQLEHPNICKLVQLYCDSNAVVYLILELVNGGDLLTLIQKRRGLAERHARDITYQICDAMAYIHAQGIVHRDLKPENILVTEEDHPIAKVADFGVAKLVDSMEMLRTRCGTPYYIAPELDDPNADGYDHKVDSWCMGVIVFAMLSGSQPFDIDDEAKYKARIVEWGVLSRTKGLDRAPLYFIHELLQRDPQARLALSDAHEHHWLRDHVPYHRNIAALYRSARHRQDNDQDAHDTISDLVEVEQLRNTVEEDNNLVTDSVDPPRAPLQRRITVLAEAAEGGTPIRQPSLQMIVNMSRQTAAGPSGAFPNNQDRNKRSLAPVLEEALQWTSDDVEMVAASPVKTPRTTRKKARLAFGTPRRANTKRRENEDVTMESPVKSAVSTPKRTPSIKPITRRSSRIKKANFRRH